MLREWVSSADGVRYFVDAPWPKATAKDMKQLAKGKVVTNGLVIFSFAKFPHETLSEDEMSPTVVQETPHKTLGRNH